MGGILTIIHTIAVHIGAILLTIAFALVIWAAGYLRGHRHGEDAEIERKGRVANSLARTNQQLRDRIDFLQAENDALRRTKGVPLSGMRIVPPPDVKLDPLPQGPRISREVMKALGPSEPPTPKNHKEVG